MLEVADGNRVYFEICGSPTGIPALAVHGGPGSGCVPGVRRPFNPDRSRIVLFDQRGCGRSTPHASDPTVDLSTNTTDQLIADIEALREHLTIDEWAVVGWSWGTTLALAYAQTHPDRVRAMVLVAITTTSTSDVAWITAMSAGCSRRRGHASGMHCPKLIVTAASSTPTPDCSQTPTPPSARRPPGTGATGRKATSTSTPSHDPIPTMPIHASECASPAWSLITGATAPGAPRDSCWPGSHVSPIFPPFWSTAGSTSAALQTSPGN
ncbi:MAG: proline iminopeptidase [Mycobacterium sp.]|nr:proline iminopeptidase [Mycobacterium sp.]